MINRVVLVGRITKDPMMRKTQSGMSVVSFTLAVNRRIQNQDQQADFINCVAWNKTADFMASYVKKGSQLGVEGRIQTRNYDGTDGKKVYVTEVVAESVQFLESKKDAASNGEYVPQSNGGADTSGYQPDTTTTNYESDFSSADSLDIASDDLPF